MTSLELAGLILAGEFALVAWAVLFFMLRYQRKRETEDAEHVDRLMAEVDYNAAARRDALSNIFSSTYKLEGEALDSTVDEYLEREKAFYTVMLDIYVERKGTQLKSMPSELTKVLAPLVHMTPSNMIDASEVGDLEQTNARLSAELDDTQQNLTKTQQTLNRLMDEYNAAFMRSSPSEPQAPLKPVDPTQEIDLNMPTQEVEKEAPAAEEEAPETVGKPPETDSEMQDSLAAESYDLGEEFDIASAPPPSEQDDESTGEEPAEDEPELAGEEPAEEETPADDEEAWQEKLEELSDLFDLPEDGKKTD